jgi:hypothetical protein
MANNGNFDDTKKLYNDMEKALSDLDYEHLLNLYKARREDFLASTKTSSHEEFTKRLLYAVISTDVCMEVFQEFLNAMAQKIETISSVAEKQFLEHKETSENALGKLEDLIQEVKSKEKGEANKEYRKTVEFRQAIYTQVVNSQQELASFRAYTNTVNLFLVTMGSTSTYGSLKKLFEIRDFSFLSEVLMLALQTIIGLIPYVGTPVSATMGYIELVKKKANKYKDGGDWLTQLDNYSDVAFTWCLITQMLIELYNSTLSIQDKETLDIEKMVGEQETNRITKIIQNKIERHISKYTGESN